MDLCMELYIHWLVDYSLLKFPQQHAQELRYHMEENYNKLLQSAHKPCGPEFRHIKNIILHTPLNQLPERLFMYMYEDPFVNKYMYTFYGDIYNKLVPNKKI